MAREEVHLLLFERASIRHTGDVVDARTVAPGGAVEARATNFPVDPVVESQSVPLLGPNGLLIDFTTSSSP